MSRFKIGGSRFFSNADGTVEKPGWFRGRNLWVASTLAAVLLLGLGVVLGKNGEAPDPGSAYFGDIYVDSSGYLRVDIRGVPDCSECSESSVQVRWLYDNLDDIWLNHYVASSWLLLEKEQDYHHYCPGDGRYRAKVEMRLMYVSQPDKVVDWTVQNERLSTMDWSAAQRLFAGLILNVTDDGEASDDTLSEDKGVVWSYSPRLALAESQGLVLATTCGG